MSLLVKDYDSIVTTMINHMAANTSTSDMNIGSVVRTFFESVAIVIDETYFQLVDMLNGFYINSASGSDLDKRLSDYGLQRFLSQPATLTLSFTANTNLTPLQPIPLGTQVTVAATANTPALTYVTTAIGTAAIGGGANVPAICTTPGLVGNIPTVSFSTWSIINNPNPSVVTGVTNTSIGYNGFDQESDSSFRSRGIAFLQSLSRGTNSAIVGACLNAEDPTGVPLAITQAKVLENYYLSYTGGQYQTTQDLAGISSGSPTPVATLSAPLQYGNITIVVDNGQGTLSFSPISALIPIINGDPVQPTIYPGYRASGIQAFITRPSILTPATITFIIKLLPTFLDTAAVITACKTAISQFVLQIPIGGTLYVADIIDVCMEISGVINVSSVSIAGGSPDLSASVAQKITIDTNNITITTTY